MWAMLSSDMTTYITWPHACVHVNHYLHHMTSCHPTCQTLKLEKASFHCYKVATCWEINLCGLQQLLNQNVYALSTHNKTCWTRVMKSLRFYTLSFVSVDIFWCISRVLAARAWLHVGEQDMKCLQWCISRVTSSQQLASLIGNKRNT